MASKYNEKIIKERIEAFKSRFTNLSARELREKAKEITILFDMDNTLFRFSIYGKESISLEQCYSKGFFKRLPVFDEAPDVVETLQDMGFNVGIITKAIDSPYCEPEKRESLHFHFPTISDNNIIIVPEWKTKSSMIPDIRNTIVVDDYWGNIQEIYDAGGIAIKKAYVMKQRPVPAIRNLTQIFRVLRELNVL